MLKDLTRGGFKLGFKMVIGIYVQLIMTVIYTLATLIGGANGLKVVKKNKKVAHAVILGVTGCSIGLKVFLSLKDTYLLCQRTGYVWLIEFLTVNVLLTIIVVGSLIYYVINLIKAYTNRREDSSNRLLIAMIELIVFIVTLIIMGLRFVPNKYYYLFAIYPVGKWFIKNRLKSVIDTVKESADEKVNVDDIRTDLLRHMNNRIYKSDCNDVEANVVEVQTATTESVVVEKESTIEDNDLSWSDLGIEEVHISEQVEMELTKSTEKNVAVIEKQVVSTPVVGVNEKQPKKKLNLNVLKNLDKVKAPDRRVRTEQLDESISNLLSDN